MTQLSLKTRKAVPVIRSAVSDSDRMEKALITPLISSEYPYLKGDFPHIGLVSLPTEEISNA